MRLASYSYSTPLYISFYSASVLHNEMIGFLRLSTRVCGVTVLPLRYNIRYFTISRVVNARRITPVGSYRRSYSVRIPIPLLSRLLPFVCFIILFALFVLIRSRTYSGSLMALWFSFGSF